MFTTVETVEELPLCGTTFREVKLNEDPVVIRGACRSERDKIVDFLESLDVETVYERFYHVMSDFRPYVDSLIDSGALIIIAELNGRIIGMAETVLCRKDYVEFGFVVAKEYRGKGIGSALCMSAGEACKKYGLKGIIAYVKRYNMPALKIAEKLGAKIGPGPEPDIVTVEACFED